MSWYKLNKDKSISPVEDPREAYTAFEDRVVCQEEVFAIRGWKPGRERISTVFLGLDHSYYSGPPLVFETMSFPEDTFSENKFNRYSTYTEAEVGHRIIRNVLKSELNRELWKALIPTAIFLTLIVTLARA